MKTDKTGVLNRPAGRKILKERHMTDRKCYLYGKILSAQILLQFFSLLYGSSENASTYSVFDVLFVVFNWLSIYKATIWQLTKAAIQMHLVQVLLYMYCNHVLGTN